MAEKSMKTFAENELRENTVYANNHHFIQKNQENTPYSSIIIDS